MSRIENGTEFSVKQNAFVVLCNDDECSVRMYVYVYGGNAESSSEYVSTNYPVIG